MAVSSRIDDDSLHGLLRDRSALMQLLGICPLLAASTTLINGLGLGIASLAVLCATNGLVSAARPWLPPPARLPALLLIIAAVVTVVELACKALFYDLHLALGIFLPLIIANCTIIARAESFAWHHRIVPSLADGLTHGAGVTVLLAVIGGIRELLGQGSLFAGTGWSAIKVTPDGAGLVLVLAPAGAFFVLALLLALRNALTRREHSGIAAPGD